MGVLRMRKRVEVCEEFFFQAEDGIRDLVRSRGLGDVYKRQAQFRPLRGIEIAPLQRRQQRARLVRLGLDHDPAAEMVRLEEMRVIGGDQAELAALGQQKICLLYTSDAADERSSVDLGGRRIIKKKKRKKQKKKKKIKNN